MGSAVTTADAASAEIEAGHESSKISDMDYHSLNAMLNLYDADGKIQFDKDREAARQYFLQHVNQNMVFFHNFEERMRYLLDNDYYERGLIEQYSLDFIEQLTD